MKERLLYLDYSKGIAILLMVMAHSIFWFYRDGIDICCYYDINQPINIKMGGVIWQIIYSFHMSLFFCVSGFLIYKPYSIEEIRGFLLKKAKRLFIPWLFAYVFLCWNDDQTNYWFLLSLFELSLLALPVILILDRINKPNRLWIDLSIVVILFLSIRVLDIGELTWFSLPVGIFGNYVLPFFVGLICKKHNDLFSYLLKCNWVFTTCLAAFVVLFMSRYYLNVNAVWVYLYKSSGILLPLIGSYIVLYNCVMLTNERLQKILSYIGRHTMPIYIIHFLFAIRIYELGDFFLSVSTQTSVCLQIISSFVFSVILIVMSLLSYKVLSKSIFLKRVMFGE